MSLFLDPTMTKKQIKKINSLSYSDVKKLIAEKEFDIEKISGKKFVDYKLQKIGQLRYILNTQEPTLSVKVKVPHKGRVSLSFKILKGDNIFNDCS